MKILFVSQHLKGNDGWSRYARDFLIEMKRLGHEVMCVTSEISKETDIKQVRCLLSPLEYISKPFTSWQSAKAVNKVIGEFSPDVVHIIVEPYGTMVPFLKLGKEKLVITVHSTYAFMPLLVRGVRRLVSLYLTRKMYSKIDLVICVSKYTRDHLLKHMESVGAGELVKDKVSVFAGGVDVSKVKNKKNKSHGEIKEILFVGALKSRKGLKEAIDALAFVKTDFIYRIAGAYNENDGYIKLLRNKIIEKNLGDKVIFMGQVSDQELENLYQNADLFLMLSTNNGADFEGYGLVYLEANLYGVPCIGPRDSGVSDAIVPEKTGYLVDQYDSIYVAETIEKVLNEHPIDPDECVRWAYHNSVPNKTKSVLEFYSRLIKT